MFIIQKQLLLEVDFFYRFSSPWRIEESLKSSSYLPGLVRSFKVLT
jgi:hypothetical protein